MPADARQFISPPPLFHFFATPTPFSLSPPYAIFSAAFHGIAAATVFH
jgi:hypothetical protein